MKTNHRRKNPDRYPDHHLQNGYRPPKDKPWKYIDKSLSIKTRVSTFSDTSVGASIPNDFTNGHRGMAKAMRGAKKFVRSRIRFADSQEIRRIITTGDDNV